MLEHRNNGRLEQRNIPSMRAPVHVTRNLGQDLAVVRLTDYTGGLVCLRRKLKHPGTQEHPFLKACKFPVINCKAYKRRWERE